MSDLEEQLRKLGEEQKSTVSSVERILAGLSEQQFFGTVEFKFEAGRIVLLRKSETIKPEHFRDNRGVLDEYDER